VATKHGTWTPDSVPEAVRAALDKGGRNNGYRNNRYQGRPMRPIPYGELLNGQTPIAAAG
jgi:hypothetical protein